MQTSLTTTGLKDTTLKSAEFEGFLDSLQKQLEGEARRSVFGSSKQFENRAREILQESGLKVDFDPHPYVFPDICIGDFGVEVKFTTNDTWRSVANSVFEGTRKANVKHVYVLFGKMGGQPAVRWGTYENCVIHVRTSHVPRFEVAMDDGHEPLFKKFGLTYDKFQRSSLEQKMSYIRAYARNRLKPGERLWWLEEQAEQEHTLPLEVRLYMRLPQSEKRRLRAEAALLCPGIVRPSRTRDKYNDAVMYILTYHGVLCPQARDLFSAGSVAMRGDQARGGNYVERALLDIQSEMREAAKSLEDALFFEYWGQSVPPHSRIREWLRKADALARDWRPSEVLFK
jgi:hypothetical protein